MVSDDYRGVCRLSRRLPTRQSSPERGVGNGGRPRSGRSSCPCGKGSFVFSAHRHTPPYHDWRVCRPIAKRLSRSGVDSDGSIGGDWQPWCRSISTNGEELRKIS